MERQPLVVLMSGAPGSGKSTLARRLGERLRLPVVKDRLREGALWTCGTDDLDEVPAGPPIFYRTIETLLACGVSLIGDMTLYADTSRPDIATRVAPHAKLVNVHCRTSVAVDRFVARMRADPLNQHRVNAVTPNGLRLQAQVFEPLDLGCPCILVDTTDGYVPPIDDVATEIARHYPPGRGITP